MTVQSFSIADALSDNSGIGPAMTTTQLRIMAPLLITYPLSKNRDFWELITYPLTFSKSWILAVNNVPRQEGGGWDSCRQRFMCRHQQNLGIKNTQLRFIYQCGNFKTLFSLLAREARRKNWDLSVYDATSALLNNVPRPKMSKISVLITYPLPFSKSRKSGVNNVPPPTRP